MSAEVILDSVPIGIAVESSRGESVRVQPIGFLSSEDGQQLIRQLEKLPSTLLMKAVGNRVSPSQVDNLLAIVRRDKTATVYVNELQPQVISKIAKAKARG